MIGKKDKELLMRLSENARMSISELARVLNVSRSTAKGRLDRLEATGVIKGYLLVLGDDYSREQVVAHIMTNIDTKKSVSILRSLRRIAEVRTTYAVSGIYDLIVVVSASSTEELDRVLDEVGEIEGVQKTLTSIVLSTKFER